jgi:hypothetical protein
MDNLPSDEQLSILEDVRANKNVMGDCVAGSGKTTTVLFIAKEFPDKQILLVTYNAALKLEVRERAASFPNLRADSYHSMNLFHYMKRGKGNTDKAIRNTIQKRVLLKTSAPHYDILIIDEAQDMKKLFFALCWKMYTDLPNKPQIVILGDKYQGVYKFMNADSRYLTLCDKVWNLDFSRKTLSTSYRVTKQIAAFVNEMMIGESRIEAVKDGPPVSYWRLHMFNHLGIVYSYIQQELSSGRLAPGDIFILAASIKSDKSPIRKLENILVQNKIPCYFPTSDEKALDNDVIKNKVVFTTFHSSKGRERKLVIIFGFDSTYYKYYAREMSQNVCPDTLYVAATRAKEKLIVIQDYLETPLPFLCKNVDTFIEYPYIDLYPKSHKSKEESTDIKPEKSYSLITTPTELVAFIKEASELELVELLETGIQILSEPSFKVDIPLKVETSTGMEDVSMINGIVIPMIQESRKTGEKSTVQQSVERSTYFMKNSQQYDFLLKYIETWDPESMNIENDILLAILFICCSSKLYHKIAQITTRNWLTYDLIRPSLKLLDDITSGATELEYEKKIEIKFRSSSYGMIEMSGRLDMYTDTTIWEVKCVETLTFEHELQVCVYQWIWKKQYEPTYGPRDFKLVNIRSGEIRIVEHDMLELDLMMKVLLDNKYAPTTMLSDEQFVESLKDAYLIEKEESDDEQYI